MRRIFCFIFPLFLIIPYLLCCGSSAVSAAELNDSGLDKINVLNYDMPGDSLSTQVYIYPNQPYVYFDLPFSYGALYYDLIVESPEVFTDVSIRGSSGRLASLNFVRLDGNNYRCYGASDIPFGTNRLGVQFTGTSGLRFTVNFLRFDVYTATNQGIADFGEMKVTPDSDTHFEGSWHRMSAPDTPLFVEFYHFGSQQFTQYSADLSSVNWRNFDYIDFFYEVRAADIYSISAYIDTNHGYRYIPFDISWGDGHAIDRNEFIGSGSTTVVPAGNNFFIMQRLYIPREVALQGSLHILVSGNYASTASGLMLNSVTGYYYNSYPDPTLVKLDEITAAIKESLSSSVEDNAAAEDFTDSMTTQKEQMFSNQQQLNNVSKPSAGDLGSITSPDVVLDQSGIALLTSVISPITNNRIVLGILTLSATLALVSYVFFGKKR